MYPRTEYEMTEADLKELMEACRPVPYIVVGGYAPPSPQENANNAWMRLGKKMGFDSATVRPIANKGNRFFTAVPSETEQQREERMAREADEKRCVRIKTLEDEIQQRQDELNELITKQ